MKKIIIITLLLVAIGISAFVFLKQNDFSFGSLRRVVTVEDFAGDVALTNGKKTKSVFEAMRISQGDMLVTGEKSWVTLKIDSDKQVMVSEKSSVSFEELSASKNDFITVLAVETGNVWTNIKEKLNGNSKFEIETPTATMGVKGTQFYVQASQDHTLLAVLDGTVSAATTIMSKNPQGNLQAEQVTLLIDKKSQISMEKAPVTTKDELNKRIKSFSISSLDMTTLRFLQKNPDRIDPDIFNEISQFLEAKYKEMTLIQDNKVQIEGTVYKPDGTICTEGGHIHIRDSKNNWVYYGLVNANGKFIAGELTDGSYWLRADPDQINDYARSNEVPFKISNGKADPEILDMRLNKIQFSAAIADPNGLPVENGYLYVSDSHGNWIYYAEIEKRNNVINIGGLPDGSYKIVAYPASDSKFVQSNAGVVTIKNDSASNINLRFNTPQFSGSVMLADGKTPASGGHVHVRNKNGQWVQYLNFNSSGSFMIGGLKDGTYWLRADSSENPGYVSSEETEIRIENGKAAPASPRLVFKR